MSVLVNLSYSQFFLFVKEWICMRQLCKLDTSLCNTSLRAIFVNNISGGRGESTVFSTPVINKREAYPNFIKWLSFRNIQIDTLELFNKELKVLEPNVVQGLRKFTFSHCWKQNISRLYDVIQCAHNLREISLFTSDYVNFTVFDILSESCPNLLVCHVRGLPGIKSNAIIRLSENCKSLQNISLESCSHIDDQAVIYLSKHSSNLTSIRLIHCLQLTDECVFSLLDHCHSLTSCEVSRCALMTHEPIQALKDKCRAKLHEVEGVSEEVCSEPIVVVEVRPNKHIKFAD